MPKRTRSYVLTYLVCHECKNVFNIARPTGQIRAKGHIKHIWCYRCKDCMAHTEYLKDYTINMEKA